MSEDALESLTKICSSCELAKDIGEFAQRKDSKDGRRDQCRKCRNTQVRKWEQTPKRRAQRRKAYLKDAEARRAYSREWHRQYGVEKLYGVSKVVIEALLVEQDGRCLICGDGGKLHVDHDHRVGQVRGLLCGRCNRGIGMFLEEPQRLRSAADYLEHWHG